MLNFMRYVSPRARRVIAVDPGELAPDVQALANVLHFRGKAEDLVPPEVLAEVDPDAVLAPNAFQREGRCRALRPEDQAARDAVAMQSADLLVCDINTHPDQCASLCRSLLPLLKPGGKLILTLKFTGTRRDRADRVANCAEILGPTVTDVKALWLFANTVCERTLCATKVG